MNWRRVSRLAASLERKKLHETQKVRITRGANRGRLATVVQISDDDRRVDVVFCDDGMPGNFHHRFVIPAQESFKQFWGIWHLVDRLHGKIHALCGPEITEKGPLLESIPEAPSRVCDFCRMIARGEEILAEAPEPICPICQTSLMSELSEEYGFPGSGTHAVRCARCTSDLDVVVESTFAVKIRSGHARSDPEPDRL